MRNGTATPKRRGDRTGRWPHVLDRRGEPFTKDNFITQPKLHSYNFWRWFHDRRHTYLINILHELFSCQGSWECQIVRTMSLAWCQNLVQLGQSWFQLLGQHPKNHFVFNLFCFQHRNRTYMFRIRTCILKPSERDLRSDIRRPSNWIFHVLQRDLQRDLRRPSERP